MVECDHFVEKREFARPVKLDIDHVALGRGDHDALDPRLALERSGVGRHEFHARFRE